MIAITRVMLTGRRNYSSGLKESNVHSFVEDVFVNGKPWASGTEEKVAASYVFVCAHNSRDKRCGVCGPPLIEKFNEEIGVRGLKDQVFVSACSHVGGHKYSGNLTIYSAAQDEKVSGTVSNHKYAGNLIIHRLAMIRRFFEDKKNENKEVDVNDFLRGAEAIKDALNALNGEIMGSIGGVPAASVVDKVWLVFQGPGDIAFAYPYSIILLEIQDTLKSPPSETTTMKKASRSAIVITAVFYLLCGSFMYATFGNNIPGNLLTGFGFYEPYWLVDLANTCVIIHLVGGYQVFIQPVFALVETWFSERYPNSDFVNRSRQLKLPLLTTFQLNPFRLGALNFWPLVVYFPVEMYFVQRKIAPWSRKWVALKTFSFACFLVSTMAFIGSLQGLITAKLS
ncbi:probable amino acid permease 7 isoform X1 [Tanacetum coccineum]